MLVSVVLIWRQLLWPCSMGWVQWKSQKVGCLAFTLFCTSQSSCLGWCLHWPIQQLRHLVQKYYNRINMAINCQIGGSCWPTSANVGVFKNIWPSLKTFTRMITAKVQDYSWLFNRLKLNFDRYIYWPPPCKLVHLDILTPDHRDTCFLKSRTVANSCSQKPPQMPLIVWRWNKLARLKDVLSLTVKLETQPTDPLQNKTAFVSLQKCILSLRKYFWEIVFEKISVRLQSGHLILVQAQLWRYPTIQSNPPRTIIALEVLQTILVERDLFRNNWKFSAFSGRQTNPYCISASLLLNCLTWDKNVICFHKSLHFHYRRSFHKNCVLEFWNSIFLHRPIFTRANFLHRYICCNICDSAVRW